LDIRSTNTQRTIESAKCFVRGLFDDVEKEVDPIIDIRMSGMAKCDTTPESIYMQHNRSITMDGIEGLNTTVDELNETIHNIFGYRIIHSNDYYDLYTTLKCYIYDAISLPETWTPRNMSDLELCANKFYTDLYRNTEINHAFTSDLFDYAGQFIKSNNTFSYISTHDSIIFPMAMNLSGTRVKLPDFCSSIRYEVWDQMIRVYYDDLLISEKYLNRTIDCTK
jgi:hypothetical protein